MATNSAFAAGFDEAGFRSAIRETMRMGMPQLDSQKLKWFWYREQSFTPDDPAGNPYDWTTPPDVDVPGNVVQDPEDDGLIVDYAFDFSASGGVNLTAIGPIDPTKLTVTVFDVDFAKIRTADYARIGNTHYRIRFESAPYALFGVTMHDIYLEAEDAASYGEDEAVAP